MNNVEVDWRAGFDEWQRNEIEFCRIYARQFAHGTDGHNLRMIVSQMADLLDEPERLRQLAALRELNRLYEVDPEQYYIRIGAAVAVAEGD